tara:strand:+ start:76 stop:483 length:408 start_codon:yes stop_codon:yes gene_type:complete
MRRRVVDVVCDEAGDRVAVLSCAHRQHVRLMPPLTRRPWTQTSDDRASMLGKTMECTTCERLELRDHETTVGVWGRIRVLEGALHYHVSAPFVHQQRVVAGGHAIIAPETPHSVAPIGTVSFCVEFLRDNQLRAL